MSSTIAIDACSSLNLFATGKPVEIVRAANLKLLVLPEVEAEARYLFGEPDAEGQRPRELVDWKGLFDSGVANSEPFPDAAVDDLVDLAGRLTDVDAKCVALAKHRKIDLLTDDGKVRRVFSESTSGLRLHSTVSMIRAANGVLNLDVSALRAIFTRIRERARFEPPRKDPEYDWYVKQLEVSTATNF